MDNLALQLRAAAERDDALHVALDQEFADLNGSSRDTQDVLDALWWAAHPLRPTPIGRTDPAVYLIELQAAVFSRAAVPEPQVERIEAGLIVRATASEHRLRQLTLNLAARAAAVDHLVTRFGRGLARSTDAAVPVDEDLAAGVSLPSPPPHRLTHPLLRGSIALGQRPECVGTQLCWPSGSPLGYWEL